MTDPFAAPVKVARAALYDDEVPGSHEPTAADLDAAKPSPLHQAIADEIRRAAGAR